MSNLTEEQKREIRERVMNDGYSNGELIVIGIIRILWLGIVWVTTLTVQLATEYLSNRKS